MPEIIGLYYTVDATGITVVVVRDARPMLKYLAWRDA
jgi:hypothetical protein